MKHTQQFWYLIRGTALQMCYFRVRVFMGNFSLKDVQPPPRQTITPTYTPSYCGSLDTGLSTNMESWES